MSEKIVQYLNEAHASEVGLVRVLQSQIAMTPRGDYRDALERHLRETRGARRQARDAPARARRRRRDPLQAGVGVAETVVAQALALVQDADRPPARHRRRGEGAQEREGRARPPRRSRSPPTRRSSSSRPAVGDEAHGQARRVDPRRRGADARPRRGRAPELAEAVVARRDRGRSDLDVAKTGAGERSRSNRKVAKKAGAKEPWQGYDKATADQITTRVSNGNDDLAKTVRR